MDEVAVISDARRRARSRMPAPDRMSGLVTGGSFLLAVAVWWLVAPPAVPSLGILLACVVTYSVAASLEFEIGPGCALPTTPVLVVSLFLVPPQFVPVVCFAGLLLSSLIWRLRDPSRNERLLVLAGSSWHSVGPAAVFAFAGVAKPAVGDAGIYALALGAQFALDAAASWIRNCWGLGVPTRRLAEPLLVTFLADLLLAPIGLAAALALPGSAVALLFLVPPVLLLAMLQRDRAAQISRAVLLSEAVAETADSARRDVLTGLRNRLAWEEAVAVHGGGPLPVGVVLADVDGLKAANDDFGHDAGDRLLVAIGALIARVTPADGGAICARLGGDEFGILLPGRLSLRADEIAQTLRAAIARTPRREGQPAISASVGYGLAVTGEALAHAFVQADRRLYVDKGRPGVNRRG